MRLLVRVAFLAVALPQAAVVEPAQPQSRTQSEIVVTGRARDALRSFVRSLSKAGPTGQIARWEGYVCPTVLGIASTQAQFMEQRILQLGRAVRLRRGGSGCTTSLVVVVAADADSFASELVRAHSADLRPEGAASLKQFVASDEPVRWISVSEECGGGGCELPNSRLTKTTKPTLQAMVIIVDASRITGYSLGEVSDYVALVALSNPPAIAVRNSRSLLSMFDHKRTTGAKFDLTEYDRAFLGGLYNIRLDDSGQAQQATILNHMRKEIPRKPQDVDHAQPPK